MNPIAGISVDALPEPRGESPASGNTGDAGSAEFGLALALAAAAHSQAPVPPPAPVVAPAPVPAGEAGGDDAADAIRTLAEDVTGAQVAVPRPASPASAPLPATFAGAGTPPVAPFPARPVAAGLEGKPPSSAPARPEPDRSPAAPAVPSGNADVPATSASAEAAAGARDASLRTADLPLTVRVLELVRDMTEQAARVALDTAMSAGPAQAGPVSAPAAADRGRGRSGRGAQDGDGPPRAAGAMLAEASAVERASLADELFPAAPGTGSPIPQGAHPSAGAADPAAGAARASALPPEVRTPARFGDQVTLHFSGEDGLEGQLRVAVRGQNVRATILADDPAAAERFSRGLGGLQRALLDRGFSEARLNVQQTVRSEGPGSGNVPRDEAHEDTHPRGEGRDHDSPSRRERESASTEGHPRRRPSRPRTER